jgi:hypothetical protein
MAPLAKGTASVDMLLVKTFVAAGVKAADCVTNDAMRRSGEVFMVETSCIFFCRK